MNTLKVYLIVKQKYLENPTGKTKNQSVINEANYDSKYIGRNRKNLKIRLNEHFSHMKYVSEEKSAVAKYRLRTGYTFSK